MKTNSVVYIKVHKCSSTSVRDLMEAYANENNKLDYKIYKLARELYKQY